MNLLSLLLGSMTSQSSVNSVAGKTGLSNSQVSKLIMLALPILLKYMTKNAASGNGAQSLLGALAQHTSNSSMDLQLKDADEDDGGKIIHHILGKKEETVAQDLSAKTGLGTDQIMKVLAVMAPALMSGVSEAASTTTAKPAASASAKPLSIAPSASGIFGALLGGGKPAASTNAQDDDDDGINGAELLKLLLSARK